jgi:nonribosomal peptide synthetase protein BlmIV
MAVRLRGPLSMPALRQAVDDIAARHQVLRSVIAMRDGVPVQEFAPDSPVPCHLVSLAGLSEETARTHAEQLLAAAAGRPFDLARGPLVRVSIIALRRGEHLVALAVHHVATDGWSVGLMAREVGQLYAAYLAGQPGPLAATPAVQYREFARIQRARDYGGALTRCTARLADLPDSELPLDHPRPTAPRRTAATWTCALPPSTTTRIEELRRAEGGSLFMLVLAALMTVIHRLDGRPEVAVGTLAAGRTEPAMEPAVGYFGNVLVTRARLDDNPAFSELWRRVREDCVAAYADQDVPYEKVLEALRRTGGTALPVIRVICVMQQEDPPISLAGLEAEPVQVPHGTAQFDITLELRMRAAALQMTFQYDTELFDEGTIRVLGGYLRQVLTAAADDPGLTCEILPLGPPAPLLSARPPEEGNGACLHQLFEDQARRTPDAVAVAQRDRAVTYRTLNARANHLAWLLRADGTGPEDRIGVYLDRSPESVIALLAVLKAGAAYVPLDPAFPAERLRYMLADSGARRVITTAALAAQIDGQSRLILIGDAVPAGHSQDLRLAVSPDNLAVVIYTSGTTGPPKGVLGPHRAVANRLRWMWRAHPFAPGERAGHRTALSFVDSIWEVLGPLLRGAPVEIIDADLVADPRRLARTLSETAVSRIVLVPGLLQALLDTVPGLDGRLPALRTWTSSGERLPADLASRFHELLPGRLLLNLYGATEVAADATAAVVPSGGPVTIGRPIDGVTAVVAGARGAGEPALIAGELLIGGAAVARGYHRSAAETAARFVPDPAASVPGGRAFRTGDRVRCRADGALEYLGRADDQVQVRGYRVEPGAVEAALRQHPAVASAAVMAYLDALGQTAIAGYIVLRADCPPGEVRRFLAGKLPPHEIPAILTTVDALPLTPSGKVDHRRLPPVGMTGDDVAPDPPRTAAERAVAAVFAELLPRPPASRDDDFFALGGHSLLAVAVLSRLLDRHGIELELRDLFAAPTIAGLAERVAHRPAGPVPGRPLPVRPRPEAWFDPFPLTDVQQAYWVGRQPDLELGNIATHSYFELHASDLDTGRLTAAVRQLVARHHALRTVILPDGTQQVLSHVPPYELDVTDLRSVSAREARRQLAAQRAARSHEVLPADRWPLFSISACLLPAGRARIGVSIDALIADALSVQILLRELGQLYQDPDARLAPLEITFRDCVVAEAQAKGLPGYQRSLRYWRDRLQGLPPGPDLPLARPAGSLPSPRFRRRSRRLPAPTWDLLRGRSAAAGLTPTAVLLAAFTEVLTAWSARSHYTVTLTLFNRGRDHPQADQVVGDFTSLLLVEVDHRRPGSFLARARQLQERMWRDLDHRAVSGVTVMREWAQARGLPPGLVAPVVFTSNLGLPDPPATGPSLGTRGFAVTQTPQLYLDHQVAETPAGLVLNWDAVDGLFPEGLVGAAFSAYLLLLERLASSDQEWEQPVRGLLPPVQRRVREVANSTAAPRSAALLHVIAASAASRDPGAPAVITPDQTLSHGDVLARASRIAHRLRDLGTRRGDLVGVAMDKGWEQVVAVLGITASGAAYVPLDPGLPAARMDYLRSATGIRYVLTQSWLAGRLPGLEQARKLAVDEEREWAGYPSDMPAVCATDRDLAYVIFTSGSTGTPKGVMIDHHGAVNTLLDINRRFGVGAADRVLGLSSLSFDLSVYDIFGLLAAGGAIVLPDQEHRRDPAQWLSLLRAAGVTIWNSVPALMGLAVEYAEARGGGLGLLRLAMLSGDWIPVGLPGRIRGLAEKAEVVSLGGATEASIWSVAFPVSEVAPGWTAIPYGRPLANQRLHVLDQAMEPRPDWVTGDLFIAGDGLAVGYWSDPRRTAAAFVPHARTGERLYRTGDLARYRGDGELELLGREDLQVKISGYRVEIAEVEAALTGLPGISAGAVAAEGPRGEKRLTAYYVAQDAAEIDTARLRAGLAAALPGYLVPATFTRLAALPLTANGKVDRAALPAPADSPAAAREVTAIPFADGLAENLSRVWELVLGVDEVQPDDSFFALGGTSLVAIRLLARLESMFGVKIPLPGLYRTPTLTGLAAAIQAARASAGPGNAAPEAVLIPDHSQRAEPFPLTDIQQAYWLGRRAALQLGGVSTHSYVELDVRGLDIARLEAALAHVIDRHPALRTVVLPDGRQRVLPGPLAYRVPRSDVRLQPPDRQRSELGRLREEMSHQVHAADHWPLFEIRATALEQDLTRLHISVDLLIADALSFRILQRELLAAYHGAPPPPPLDCTFRDYVLAAERLRAGDTYQEARRYWEGRLADLPPAPPLPLLRELPEIFQPRFERLEDHVDAANWAALRTAAAARGLTPSGLLCAAFADVLAMWSQRARFTINLTTFNRLPLHPDVESMVGDFTSTSLLAVDATAASFAARAARLQEQIFRDLEHRMFSGIEVLRLLRASPRSRADALAPIVFTSTLLPEPASAAVSPPAWDARLAYSVSQTPQVLLDLQVHEHLGALSYTWDHVAGAFPPGMVEAMFTAYGRLLRSLTSAGAYWEAGPGWTP